MTTLKELKAKKVFAVTRIDKNFINNEEVIKQFEEQAKQQNYEVVNKKETDYNYMEYTLINKDEEETLRYYVKQDERLIKDILEKQTRNIIKHETDEEYLYVTVQGKILNYSIRLNPKHMKETLQGKIVLRSKDYYFEFTDKENNKHQLFSSGSLKASNIQDNKILVDGCPLEYIIND